MRLSRRINWSGCLSIGRIGRSLLLPLLLLVAQHGALLHELSHYAGTAETPEESDKQKSGTHPCELCLAFAQVESTATTDVAVPALLSGLSYATALPAMVAVRAAELPSQRNRGPPVAL